MNTQDVVILDDKDRALIGEVPSMGIIGTCKAPATTEEQNDEGVN